MLAELETLSTPSNVWNDVDIDRGLRLVDCVMRFMLSECHTFIAERKHEPMLVWYGFDGTEHRYKKSKLSCIGKHMTVRRLRAKQEFLQHRCFYIGAIGGTCAMAFEAVLLTSKTVWSHFEAYRQSAVHPRLHSHVSILVKLSRKQFS